MRSEQPSLLRGQRFIAIAVLPTVFAASGPNAWASTACTADPVANTAQILCGPSSGPCTSTEVTVSGTIDLLGPTCEFDLGARSLNVTGTLQIAADGRIEIYNVLSATVSGTGKLKARGDLNLPPGQVGSGGNITLLAVDAVLLTSGSLLDVSGDPSGTINVVGSTITTQAGSLIRGNGVAAVTIEGDGGTVQLVGLTGYVLMGGAIEMRGQSDGQGGEVFASAATDVTLAAFVDVSGGSGDGGVIELAAGDHVAITHTLDMDSRGDGGSGGSLNIEAGNDSLGGAVAGGSVSIDNVTLKMRGSSGDGFGGDGGTLDISAKGNIALVGSAFTLRADAATALDGFGGSVVLDSTDDSPVSIGPLDGDITIAGAILAKGGSDGGTGGAFLASAGRAFSTTAQIDLAGRQGGGELLVEAGDAVVWNGTLIAEATSAAGEPGIVSMLAGSAVNAPLTIVSNVLAAGGAQSSAGYEILLSGCQLTVEESVKIDGTAGFGGSKIELISLDAMHLKSASKYLASANGHVVLTHPTTITPLIGSNATFNPPYTDNPTADAPYPGCGLIPTPTPQPTFTPGPTSQETPDPLPPGASSGEPPREDRISAAVYERLMRDDRIPVMIVFAPPSVPFGSARGRSERRAWQDTEAPRWRGAIQQNSQRVLDFLAGTDFEVRFRYNYIPALSGYVTIRGVEALRNNPLVMAVDVLPATEASLLQAREWTDLQAVHNLRSLPSPPGAPFDGSGVTIGIIDGGVDSNTPDIDHAQVVDQRCFCVDPCPPPPNVAEDNTGGHGTQHTGVLISNGSGAGAPLGSSVGSNAKGAAKGASVIALKVACPGSSLAETADQIVAAFDWVLANPTAVDVISNSWQFTGVFPIPCDGHSANTQAVAAAVGQLRFLGIPSFMAAGNEASGTPVHPAFGIKQPSCVEDAITVGAVGDNFAPGTSSQGKPDELTGFSNFDPLMDLVDVGEHLVVAGLGGIVPTDPATGFPMIWGTSFANGGGMFRFATECLPGCTIGVDSGGHARIAGTRQGQRWSHLHSSYALPGCVPEAERRVSRHPRAGMPGDPSALMPQASCKQPFQA